jgi:hypothetical protein
MTTSDLTRTICLETGGNRGIGAALATGPVVMHVLPMNDAESVAEAFALAGDPSRPGKVLLDLADFGDHDPDPDHDLHEPSGRGSR